MDFWPTFLWAVTVVLLVKAVVETVRFRESSSNTFRVVGSLFFGAALLVSHVPWLVIALIFCFLTGGMELIQRSVRPKSKSFATSLGTIQMVWGLEALVAICATLGTSITNWFGFLGWTLSVVITIIIALIMGWMCWKDEGKRQVVND